MRALLIGLIDYAGLFPPAQLPMPAAVYNYAHYRTLPYSWVLGRFIVPASRFEEFEREAVPLLPPPGSTADWRLSLLSDDPANDVKRVAGFNRNHPGALFDSIEIKAGSATEVEAAAEMIPHPLQLYCEVPLAGEFVPLLAAIAKRGARAKVRCGGMSAEMFPAPGELAGFLRECLAAGAGFKATAGLHHHVRGTYPLSYEPRSPTASMHGFLNVFLGAGWVRTGMTAAETVELLDERSAAAFRFVEDGVSWRDHHLDVNDIVEMRKDFGIAFGSCSFSEPVADLRKINLI